MDFEDAQDIAYRFAQAAYVRKLRRLVGEKDIAKLAGSLSRHTVLLAVDGQAISIKVTIECGKAVPCADLEALISESNKVRPR